MNRKILFTLLLLTGLIFPSAPALAQSQNAPQGFVYAEGESLMLDGQPYFMKGINYYPRDYGWTSMLDWDWQEVEQELELAASLHVNVIRTGISYLYGTDNASQTDSIYSKTQVPGEYLERVDQFLELADRHDIKVIFWLNDQMPWELYNPQNFVSVENYLQSVIPRYANDPRVAAWDLATDLDGSLLTPSPTGGYGTSAWMNRDNMVVYLEKVAETVRRLDPNHLVAVGSCWPASALLVQDFTDFVFFQFLGGDHPEILTEQGATSPAEDYVVGNASDEQVWDSDLLPDRLEQKLLAFQAQLIHPMPIVLSEYGLYSGGESSEARQSLLYQSVLEVAFLRLHLAGALNWALTDFIWPPKDFSTVAADDPAISSIYERTFGIYNLDYTPKLAVEVVKAYYADAPILTIDQNPEQVEFVFTKTFVPGGEDQRQLSAAFDTLSFIDRDGRILQTIDFGEPAARQYMVTGFFSDEGPWEDAAETFTWAGGRAVVAIPFPEGTASLAVRMLNGVADSEMDVLVEGQKLAGIALPPDQWKTVNVDLPLPADLKEGDPITLLGHFNIPISEGQVTLFAGSDTSQLQSVATITPAEGRFSVQVSALPGMNVFRAEWEGSGSYRATTSNDYSLTASIIEETVPPQTEVSSTGAVPVRATAIRLPIWTMILMGGLLLAGLGLFLILKKTIK